MGPGGSEAAVDPKDGDNSEGSRGVNGRHGCHTPAHKHTKLPILGRESDHNSRGFEVGHLGYRMGARDRQTHRQGDLEVERLGTGIGILSGNLQTHGQAEEFPDTHVQSTIPTPRPALFHRQNMTLIPRSKLGRSLGHRSRVMMHVHEQESDDSEGVIESLSSSSNSHSDGSASSRQLSAGSSLRTSMSLNAQADGGTDGREPIGPSNKQNLLSVQLSKMTSQGLAEWMAKKERETRNRLRREGRDKGFRDEQALLKYVNDRIEEPSKSDWPGLKKCPIVHARGNEEKRAKRRETERGRLAWHRMTNEAPSNGKYINTLRTSDLEVYL